MEPGSWLNRTHPYAPGTAEVARENLGWEAVRIDAGSDMADTIGYMLSRPIPQIDQAALAKKIKEIRGVWVPEVSEAEDRIAALEVELAQLRKQLLTEQCFNINTLSRVVAEATELRAENARLRDLLGQRPAPAVDAPKPAHDWTRVKEGDRRMMGPLVPTEPPA